MMSIDLSTFSGYLCLDLGLHLAEGNGAVVIVVHAHIVPY